MIVTAVGGVTAWRGSDQAVNGAIEPVDSLPPDARDELCTAARMATRGDAPQFAGRAFVRHVTTRVFEGSGALVLRNMPLGPSDQRACEVLLEAILSLFGTVLPQNVHGDPIYTVIDRSDPRGFYGGSRATGALLFHTDQAAAPEAMLPDLLALWCLQPAMSGGENILASGHALHDALLTHEPSLAASLYRDAPFGRDADGVSDASPVLSPVFRMLDDGQVRVRYNEYFTQRGAQQLGIDLPRDQADALAFCEGLLASGDLGEVLALEAGDLLLADNRVVLHNRTAYEDWPDGTSKRRLLRGWARCPALPRRERR
jgi:hypothetical protein